MGKIYFFFVWLFFIAATNYCFAQKIAFSYDASGNQIERRYICINCPSSNKLANAGKLQYNQNIESDNKKEESSPRSLLAYPNPVSETLSLSWQTPEEIFLKSIEIFSIGGNRVFSASYNSGQRDAQISFLKFPPGTYILTARYSDAKTKHIKLIKI